MTPDDPMMPLWLTIVFLVVFLAIAIGIGVALGHAVTPGDVFGA